MLCKKCKTAVSDDAKICMYCGAKIRRSDNRMLIYPIIIGVAVCLGIGGYFLGQVTKEPSDNRIVSSADVPEPETTEEPEQLETEEKKIVIVPPSTPEPTAEPPVSEPDASKTIDDIWALIDNVLIASNQYYDQYNKNTAFVTKEGYLYDVPAKEYVKVKDLVDVTDLDTQYSKDTVFIYYLKPRDLKKYESLNIKDGDKLEIFCAYETPDGFAISSLNSAGGIITREDLHELLQVYSTNHGNQERFEATNEEYQAIATVICNALGLTNGLDMRYVCGDEKYAFAVISPKGNSANVKEFILQKEDDQWKIILSDFERTHQYKTVVNQLAPDFSLDLTPSYDMYYHINYITDNAQVIYEAMRETLLSEKDGNLIFSSGADTFCYFEFDTGLKFVGHYTEEKGWTMYPVIDYVDAEFVMKGLEKDPPYFILIQD